VVVGAGYWGPNLVRNFNASDEWTVRGICDRDLHRAGSLARHYPAARVSDSLEAALEDPGVDAVAIATPAATHEQLALTALEAGKHVLVEKPLAATIASGQRMVRTADQRGLVLMADHTYCYTPAVTKIAELVAAGELGDILFVDSVRINLGLVQPDVDVFWDLAPHDLSILDYVLPGGLRPTAVAAQGADPLNTGRSCVGYLSLPLPGDAMAHVHVNWLSPTKIRQMVIGGSQRTLVWDDLNPQQRVSVYDRGVDLAWATGDAERKAATISYRLGDTWAPALPEREALGLMVGEFAASIREGRAPRTDGLSGLRVLSVLQSTAESLAAGGALVRPKTLTDLQVIA
jgi:predicted dehydrogenase